MSNGSKYLPEKCPLCNETVSLVSDVRRDMPCVHCGYYLVQADRLLVIVRELVAEKTGDDPATLSVEFSLSSVVVKDSLDMVELVMDLEDRLPTHLVTEDSDQKMVKANSEELTIGDIVRYYCRHSNFAVQ